MTSFSSLTSSHTDAIEDAGIHLGMTLPPKRWTRASRPRRWVAACCSVAALALGITSASAADEVFGAFNDDARPLAGWDAATVAAGQDAAKLADLARQLVAVLQSGNSTAAEKESAAEHLGPILQPDQATLAALAPMLSDDARVDYARLALDRVPGEAIDALFIDALKSAQGRSRVGAIQSIGARRISAAIPALGALVASNDAATAAAAIDALGRIGGPSALSALGAARDVSAPSVLDARLEAAAKCDPAIAARAAEGIFRDASAPTAQRAAGLRLWIAAAPQSAVGQIREALAGSEPMFRKVALESVATLPVSGGAAQLADGLASYEPAVQVALAAALASHGDGGAVSGLLAALNRSDADVRLAAIDALGRLPGDQTVAQALAKVAAGGGAEAKAAGESLARLNGPGLDDFVQKSAATGDAKLRAVYVQAIADRNLTSAIPFLVGLRQDAESGVRLAALDALRTIATAKQEPAVIEWALGAPNKNEQNRAVRALIAIILRDDDADSRAKTVLAAIEGGDAAARVALLPVLSRVAGAAALDVAGRLALDADATVATAAAGELSRWPEAAALPVLVHAAVATKVPAVRSAAVRGAAHFLEEGKRLPAKERADQALALIELPLSAAEQNSLLRVLSLCRDPRALEAAKRFVGNEATAAEARDAVDAITSNLAGPPAFQAASATDALANLSDGNDSTVWLVRNQAGEWLSADLKHSRPIHRLTLDPGPGRGWGYAAELDVYVSDDPKQEGAVRVHADGGRENTLITLPAGVRGRYVWLRQTGKRDAPWVIAEFLVE